MIVLLTCGVCSMVETAAGPGFGRGCPRCGSRDIDTIELPTPARRSEVAQGDDVAPRWGLMPTKVSGMGGMFVPRHRAA